MSNSEKKTEELVKGPTLICSFFQEICRFIDFFSKIPEPFFENFWLLDFQDFQKTWNHGL